MGIGLDDCCRSLTGDEATFPSGGILPLVVDVASMRKHSELLTWLERRRSEVQARLLRHGAILFRGATSIQNVSDFQQVAQALEPELARTHPFDDGPRGWRSEYVWDAGAHVVGTPYSRAVLPFHNEDGYMPVLPRRLLFCSLVPASHGGETSLTDCRRVLADIPSSTLEKATRRHQRVRTVLPIKFVIHNARVQTAAEAEALARAKSGAEVSVKGDYFVFTSNCPAVLVHPETGERLWANRLKHSKPSGHFFELLLGSLRTRGALRWSALHRTAAAVSKPHIAWPLLKDLLGVEADPEGISAIDEWNIVRAYWKNAVLFRWRKGDFVIVDNLLMAHGRMPFRGNRDLVGALVA